MANASAATASFLMAPNVSRVWILPVGEESYRIQIATSRSGRQDSGVLATRAVGRRSPGDEASQAKDLRLIENKMKVGARHQTGLATSSGGWRLLPPEGSGLNYALW